MDMKKEPPKRGPGRPATGKSPIRYFRMEDDAWGEIEQAASQADTTVSAWIRDCLMKAAKRAAKR
jgi:hypothetical protein